MTVFLLPNARQQFFDTDGNPIVGGTVETYIPETLTEKTTYQDSDGSIPNENPLTLDDLGSAVIWGQGYFREIVKDVNGNLIWDGVTSGGTNSDLTPGVYPNATVTVDDDGNISDVESGQGSSLPVFRYNDTQD